MTDTPNLQLPYLAAAQAQKHVTHNEALRMLDAVVQLSVADRDLSAPPGAPVAGIRYLVAAAASGAWAGKSGQIAAYQDGAWAFYVPRTGWLCFVADEGVTLAYTGSAWVNAAGLGASSVTVAAAAHAAATALCVLEDEVTLSGAFTDAAIAIPDRAIVLAVTTRTTVAITGATSYACGIAGDTTKYGNLLGVAAGSSNAGVTGPTAFYAATNVRLTANGGAFTGGKVRLAIHTIACSVPAN